MLVGNQKWWKTRNWKVYYRITKPEVKLEDNNNRLKLSRIKIEIKVLWYYNYDGDGAMKESENKILEKPQKRFRSDRHGFSTIKRNKIVLSGM